MVEGKSRGAVVVEKLLHAPGQIAINQCVDAPEKRRILLYIYPICMARVKAERLYTRAARNPRNPRTRTNKTLCHFHICDLKLSTFLRFFFLG